MLFGVLVHRDGGGILIMLAFLHVGLIWIFCMNECWCALESSYAEDSSLGFPC